MKSISQILVFLFILLASNIFAHNLMSTRNKDTFDLIENIIDTNEIKFIKAYKGTCFNKESSMIQLFNSLRNRAINCGANGYKFKSQTFIDSNNTIEIFIDAYWISDSLKIINNSYHEKNAIYIFGSDLARKSIMHFRFNEIKTSVQSGTYFKYVGNIGERVTINKGGLFGATLYLNFKNVRSSVYISFKGFSVFDPPYTNGGLSIGWNTGRIIHIDEYLGRFLTFLLKEIK